MERLGEVQQQVAVMTCDGTKRQTAISLVLARMHHHTNESLVEDEAPARGPVDSHYLFLARCCGSCHPIVRSGWHQHPTPPNHTARLSPIDAPRSKLCSQIPSYYSRRHARLTTKVPSTPISNPCLPASGSREKRDMPSRKPEPRRVLQAASRNTRRIHHNLRRSSCRRLAVAGCRCQRRLEQSSLAAMRHRKIPVHNATEPPFAVRPGPSAKDRSSLVCPTTICRYPGAQGCICMRTGLAER